jgi:superfamily II DNA/RNA helicase
MCTQHAGHPLTGAHIKPLGVSLQITSCFVVSLQPKTPQVLEEVGELLGPALLPVTKQLLHHRNMPPYKQRQTIALGSSALPQPLLLAAAADALQPSARIIRATWPLQQQQQQPSEQQQLPQEQQQQQPQQEQQQQPQQEHVVHSLSGASAPLTALLSDPAAAQAAAAAATAAAICPRVGQRFVGVAPQLKHRTLLRLLSGGGGGATAAAAGGSAAGVGAAAAAGGIYQGPTVVFTNSATVADEVVAQLEAAGVAAGALHHMRSQNQREEALQCFRFGVTQVLVACGVAYRGLDLPDVSLVVNYEVPLSLAEYARRVGLVGRQGREGAAMTLVTPAEGPAAVPLVALLTAAGQAVPDWLAALAAGSTSSGGGEGGSSSSAGAEAAAGGADTSSSSRQQQQQQRQGSGGVFTVSQPDLRFGGYSSSSSSRARSRKGPKAGAPEQ